MLDTWYFRKIRACLVLSYSPNGPVVGLSRPSTWAKPFLSPLFSPSVRTLSERERSAELATNLFFPIYFLHSIPVS